jgi:hypothetical protein
VSHSPAKLPGVAPLEDPPLEVVALELPLLSLEVEEADELVVPVEPVLDAEGDVVPELDPEIVEPVPELEVPPVVVAATQIEAGPQE